MALRYAVRQLVKSPGFSVTVLATLALCIGLNTAIFSVLDAVLLRPLPYPEPERLALVITAARGGDSADANFAQTGVLYEVLRDRVAGLEAAAFSGVGNGVNFSANARTEHVQQQRVASGFFHVLGVQPAIGREFTRAEDVPDGAAVAVLSDAFWRRVFHGDRSVIGKAIDLKGEAFTVIGVMPAGFRTTGPVDVWTPLRPSRDGEGSGSNYGVVARLKPGVSWAVASEELRAISAALRADTKFPKEYKDFEERIVPFQAGVAHNSKLQLWITWAAVVVVLIIGCVNIAGLLLARSGARAREIATRIALGAGRGTIVRQLFLESLLLAIVGGLAGAAVGGFAVDWLKPLGAERMQLWHPIELDARVLGTMMAVSLATSLIFGLAPAFQTTRLDIRSVLAAAGRGNSGPRRHWTRGALVAAEVALSVVLLVGAGLLVRTLQFLNGLNPGFDTKNVIAAEASLQDKRYATAEAVNLLYTRTLERVRRIPGVQSAAVALTLPFERPLNNGMRTNDGVDRDAHAIEAVYTTPGYFQTMRIPMLAGREFRDGDTMHAAPVAIVSQSFAKKYFRGDAMGHHVSLGGDPREVVGVVGDVQQSSGITLANGPLSVEPTVYFPAAQVKDGFFQLVHTWFSPKWAIRTVGPVAGLAEKVQAAVTEVDPRLPIAHFRTVDELRGMKTGEQRYLAALFSIFAGLAVMLAAIGLYGLISQAIAQRRHELGIRLALGATVGQTIAGAMRPGIVLAAIGVAAGLAGSVVAGRVLRSLLWGVRETDPLTMAVTAAVLLVVACGASLMPALRILRMDPAETLRSE